MFPPRVALCLALAAAGATVACGSDVTLEATGAGGGGGSGATSTSSASSGTGGGGGGGLPCGATHDALDFSMQTWDGLSLGCGTGFAEPQGTFTYEGTLQQTADGQLTIDSCSPAADCLPMVSTLRVSAQGLSPYLRTGSYVRVTVYVAQPMGCEQAFTIVNLPEWDGVPNPVTPERRLWLAGADGTTQTLQDSPFGIEELPLGCHEGGAGDDYALRFFSAADPGGGLTLGMGQTGYLEAGPGEAWIVRNLRSFESGAPDDFWDWAYWLAQPYPPD